MGTQVRHGSNAGRYWILTLAVEEEKHPIGEKEETEGILI